jgi:hypothetical protein
MPIRPTRGLFRHRCQLLHGGDGPMRDVEEYVVPTSRKPQDGIVLCGRHDEPVFPGDFRVESLYACGRVIGSDFVPQLRPEPYDQVDSANGGSRLAQSGDCENELFPVAFVQDIKFQVRVRCRSKSEYSCLRSLHGSRIATRTHILCFMLNRIGLAATGILICALSLQAHVTRVVVEHRESPAFDGHVFGHAGQYEILSGHFFGEIDPKDPHNSIITDIQYAPRNTRGMVEYSATFALAKPINMSKSNGVLYYTVSNRGRGAPVGSDDGRVNLLSGWQGDLPMRPDRQTIMVPVARKPDGSPLTGPVLERLINIPAGTTTMDLGATPYVGLTYQHPLTLDTTKARLMRRTAQNTPATAVPSGDWAFADCNTKPFPGVPNESKLCVKGGFDPDSEYVLTFTAKDPLVLGIGYAATRDVNSFLHYAAQDDTGTPNPLAHQIKWAIFRPTRFCW